AGIGPPGIDLDAMVLPNQVLDSVNTPCVKVSEYWKIKPPHLRHSLVVTVSSLRNPGWMAQYATNPKMLATAWRLLAKNPSTLVVASISEQNAAALFVLVSFVSAASGLAALGDTGELGTSPQHPARAGGFLNDAATHGSVPSKVRLLCLGSPGKAGLVLVDS
ncbi:hypothetical protein THAOC_22502, partial [Thalassiosira oceanica]